MRPHAVDGPVAPAIASPMLSLVGISKRWGSRVVLDDISLDLAPGELVHIHGRNGAGKTTLLRIVAGVLIPNSGKVTMAGGLTPEHGRRRYQQSVGFLPAGDRGLYARLTARQNLEFWSALAFVDRSARDQAIDRVVGSFLPEPLAGQRVDRMSTGQRQRVRLAMAFLHVPTLVLLDEPTASLDEEGIETLSRALRNHRDSGGSALCCSPGGDRDLLPFDRGLTVQDAGLVPG